jgi:putative RecB family exonuclease
LNANTVRDYISYSAISTYRSCPLKYKFRYIDGLPSETIPASLVFGTAIHAAIEEYFMAKLSGDSPVTREKMLEVYHASWATNDQSSLQLGKSETVESLEALASRMIDTFLASSLTKLEGRILGVEETLRGPLLEGVPDLLGVVDLLIESENTLSVIDFKTSRSTWTLDQAIDSSEQLLLYCDLVGRLMPEKNLRLRFAVLTKTKVPEVQQIDLPFSQERLDRTKKSIGVIWKAIESGNFYPNPSVMQCTGCGYRKECAAWPQPPT